MTTKISQWSDSFELLKKENSIELKVVEDKKTKLINEAKRIKAHSLQEHEELEATLYDGL